MESIKAEASKLGYDHVPEKLRPPKLKRKESAKFRVYGTYDPITREGRLVSAIRIPYKDVIIDDEGEDIIIELLDRIDASGTKRYMSLWITDSTSNILVLNGSNAKDRRIYEYLMICNYNASNPNRDPSAPKLVEVIDEVANAQSRRGVKQKKRDAIRIAEDMTDNEVKQYFAGRGQSVNKDIVLLREMIEFEAEDNPDKFLAGALTTEKKMDGDLRLASKEGVIKFDKESSTWQFADGTEICKVKRGVGVSQYGELVKFIASSEAGQRVYDSIKKEAKTIG